jgi:hypothetical protein
MLEGEFFGSGAHFTAGTWVGAACRGIEAATDVARGARVLGEKAIVGAIKTAGGIG